jgi:MFS family permease
MIPAGIAISGLSTLVLSYDIPVALAAVIVTVLSLGCDMAQPALGAIATDLSPKRGLAIGFFAFSLFTGFGLGSLVFGGLLPYGLGRTFFVSGALAIAGAVCAGRQFRDEGLSNAAPANRS